MCALSCSQVHQLQQHVKAERDQRLALVAKLQRLELQRRSATDELNELSDQLRVLQAAAGEADILRGGLAAAHTQSLASETAYESAAEQVVILKSQLRATEEVAEKR